MPYILQPADFQIVQTVFRSLVEADWFDRTPANERACTQLVLVVYGTGGKTVDELHAKCIDTAREIFSKAENSPHAPSGTHGR